MRIGEKPLLDKSFADLYPDHGSGDDFSSPCSYTPIIEGFGYDVALREDEDDYQGSTFVLYRDASRQEYGVLIFGWGSCSGCDTLQACYDERTVMDLRSDLHDCIIWFDDKDDAHAWFSDREQSGSYYAEQEMWKAFRDAALAIIDGSV